MSRLERIEGVYVDGKFLDPGESFVTINPSTGVSWGEVTSGTPAEIDKAVGAARAAQRGWSRKASWERAGYLRRLADLILSRADDLASLESRDNGKPIADTRDEVARAAEWLHFFAGAAATIFGSTIPLDEQWEAQTFRGPIGVVGAITPWNSPFYIYMWKLAPALAMGNTVVLKPSELAPASSWFLARLAQEVGLPNGVLNVVAGEGPATGVALASHPDVDMVSFTGSVTTGRQVAESAARQFKRVTIEAGGKAPLVILDDADLDEAVKVAVRAGFRSAGQSCAQAGRILVHRSVREEFTGRLVAACRELSMGDALDERTQLGPLISAAALERVTNVVNPPGGRYEVLCGGTSAAEGKVTPGGYFFEPTVIDSPDPSSVVFQEEVFGPVVTITPFDTDEEALKLANGVELGLVAGVMGRDVRRIGRLVRDLEVGVVCVNGYRPGHWLLPYGGRKASGMGVENGVEALYQASVLKTVVLAR